jgi:hypothetical protein
VGRRDGGKAEAGRYGRGRVWQGATDAQRGRVAGRKERGNTDAHADARWKRGSGEHAAGTGERAQRRCGAR